jgi:predicted DNA-binding protein (UPF0251 family)
MKLNPDLVGAIRLMHDCECRTADLAHEYGVSQRQIQRVVAYHAWKLPQAVMELLTRAS